jgi:EAL domain-containing protein (putative c-di-GMP-specific phosphodiesterase class I)
VERAATGRRVSINLSARSLSDPELTKAIETMLREGGVSPGQVGFEYTETAAVSSVEDARKFTQGLLEIGCDVALDDFGTGFGSFVLLKHLPVSTLKIDIEFVRGLSSSEADRRIVRSIVHIASEAKLKVVAEGVEDEGALALLRGYGVDFAQGYFIGRPAPIPA